MFLAGGLSNDAQGEVLVKVKGSGTTVLCVRARDLRGFKHSSQACNGDESAIHVMAVAGAGTLVAGGGALQACDSDETKFTVTFELVAYGHGGGGGTEESMREQLDLAETFLHAYNDLPADKRKMYKDPRLWAGQACSTRISTAGQDAANILNRPEAVEMARRLKASRGGTQTQ